MASKRGEGGVVLAFSGKWISWTHTIVAYTAFLGALLTGLYLHYHKIVENEYYVRAHPMSRFTSAYLNTRAIPKNGFPQSLQPSAIDILSAQSSSFSSLSLRVSKYGPSERLESDIYM